MKFLNKKYKQTKQKCHAFSSIAKDVAFFLLDK